MSAFGFRALLRELPQKRIIAPERYRYLRTRAAIARDQLGLDPVTLEMTAEQRHRVVLKKDFVTYVVSWDSLFFWSEEFELYKAMLLPEIEFSTTIAPDVVVISEAAPVQKVIPWKGTWETIADGLPRNETKDGPKTPPL